MIKHKPSGSFTQLAEEQGPLTKGQGQLPKHSQQTFVQVAKDLLTFADLKALGVPWSRSHLYRLMQADRFPRPVATGPNTYDTKLWRRSDYERWLGQLQPAELAGDDGEAA